MISVQTGEKVSTLTSGSTKTVYVDFCGGYVQSPRSQVENNLKELKGTKGELAKKYHSNYKVVRRLTNE